MRSATRERCTYSVHAPQPVHQKPQPTKENRLSAAIIRLPTKVVANLTGASVDTVKSWRSGRRFPDWEYLKKLQCIPTVREFTAHEFGFANQNAATGIVAGLQQLANDSTPEAAEARALLRSLVKV